MVSPDIGCPVDFLTPYFAPWADFTRAPIFGALYSIQDATVRFGSSRVEATAYQTFPSEPLWIASGCKTKININRLGCETTFKAVLLHEIGHCLGLAHSTYPDSMMNFSVLVGVDGRVLEPAYEPQWVANPSLRDKLDLYRTIS